MYKEYDDSAWNLWAQAGVRSVAEYVAGDPAAIKAALQERAAAFKVRA